MVYPVKTAQANPWATPWDAGRTQVETLRRLTAHGVGPVSQPLTLPPTDWSKFLPKYDAREGRLARLIARKLEHPFFASAHARELLLRGLGLR